MTYVDGFVVPVPIAGMAAYLAQAQQMGALWREHGALQYCECRADDVKPGKLTSFPQSVLLKDDETVVLAWIVYTSRAHRDEVMAKVMADPRMAQIYDMAHLPFDAKRMFFGGFEVMLDL